MSYSIDDIKKGDMLWFEIRGADQSFGYGEVAYTWKDEEVNPDAKPDLRNKDKNKINPNSNSRKSEASKKNKKRWY